MRHAIALLSIWLCWQQRNGTGGQSRPASAADHLFAKSANGCPQQLPTSLTALSIAAAKL